MSDRPFEIYLKAWKKGQYVLLGLLSQGSHPTAPTRQQEKRTGVGKERLKKYMALTQQ